MPRARSTTGPMAAVRRVAAAVGPHGFRTDHPDLRVHGDATRIGNNVHDLVKRGEMFVVRTSARRAIYFGRADWAAAYAQRNGSFSARQPTVRNITEVGTPRNLRPDGEPIITEKTKFTVCPVQPQRFTALDELPGVGALLRGRRYA